MGRTREIPCLLLDESGQTFITIVKGKYSFFGNPDWRCPKVDCPIRCKNSNVVGLAYEKVKIKLGDKSNVHGVVKCEGVN